MSNDSKNQGDTIRLSKEQTEFLHKALKGSVTGPAGHTQIIKRRDSEEKAEIPRNAQKLKIQSL